MHETDGLTAGGLESRVRTLIEEVIRDKELFLVEVRIRGQKGSQVVDIFVDSDQDLDVEALARVSREVEFLLDAEDVIPGRYSLNVSSPGLDRPLQAPRQYRKNLGRLLRVKYRTGEAEAVERVEGELIGAGEEAIELSVAKEKTLHIPYQDIIEAKIKLPW